MTRPILISRILALTLVVAGMQTGDKGAGACSTRALDCCRTDAVEQHGGGGHRRTRFKADLSFRLFGRLIARPVKVGDLVGQGDVIAAIDPIAFEIAVRSAKAELAKSQAQLANISATEDRQRTLITTDATTKATLDNAVQARASAEAAVAHAQAN